MTAQLRYRDNRRQAYTKLSRNIKRVGKEDKEDVLLSMSFNGCVSNQDRSKAIQYATKRPSIPAISHKSTLGVANKSFQSTTKYNLFLWLNSRLQLLHDLLPRITRKHKQKQALNERNAKRDTAVLLQDGFYRNATNPGHTHPGRYYFYSWVVSTISTCPSTNIDQCTAIWLSS